MYMSNSWQIPATPSCLHFLYPKWIMHQGTLPQDTLYGSDLSRLYSRLYYTGHLCQYWLKVLKMFMYSKQPASKLHY